MSTASTHRATVWDCDLLVIGSGAGGLAAAVTAAHQGLQVLVVEKAPVLGGASAWSGGWMWLPGNPLARRAGWPDDRAQVRRYLQHELGAHYQAARVEAFLAHAGPAVAFFEQHTALQFADGSGIPDIHGDSPGAATGGHQVAAAPLDGRCLGPLLHRLRRPMRETAFLGMPIMAGPDLAAFLSLTRSVRSLRHVLARVSRHLWDLARHGRAMQLVNGVALVARLAQSAEQRGVRLLTSAPAQQLLRREGGVCGARLETREGPVEVQARCGVVLATGGFAQDAARRRALFPRTPSGLEHLALPPASCSGDGITLGESVGGRLATDLAAPAAWAPVSRVPHADGSVGHFPHIIDRGKPGVIGVLASGQRFVNEADGYYDYTTAMLAAVPEGQPVVSWLVCDHRFLRRYGLGHVKPFPLPIGPALRSGYLLRGATIEALARRCGIDPLGLSTTVAQYNAAARRGEDPAFGRGRTPYNRKQGDPLHPGPNPCVAPIEHGPFYAVQVQPGSFGTFAGLAVNAQAQVLDAQDQPVPGLYAVGADMASVMGGVYPSGGINLGPALTFGYLAAHHAAGTLAQADAQARAYHAAAVGPDEVGRPQ